MRVLDMPKNKQVIFQNSIPGKFIPRNAPPPGSVFRSGINDNRFNAKMAELLASSSLTVNNENELVSTKSSQNDPTTTTKTTIPEIISNDSSHVHSKLLHRRIVTMLETLRKTNDDTSAFPLTSSHKSQPITFGQLRQATISSGSATIIEDKSTSPQITIDIEEKYHKKLITIKRDSCPDLTSITSKSSGKHQTNKERLYYSPSLEKLFEEQNVISQSKKDEEQNVVSHSKKEEEQTQKSSLTVDEILAMYYSKVNLPTNVESHLPSSTYSNTTTGFYIHPSGPRWNSLQSNQHNISPPPRLMSNEQNRNRPPPPPYSSSVNYGHRTTSTVSNSAQHLIHPSVSLSLFEHLYPGSSTSQHLLTENSSNILPNSSSPLISTMTNPVNNNPIRPPPPRYKSPTPNIENSHSILPSTNDSSQSSQQSKPNNNNLLTGFDREFSRLLYGKDVGKTRRQKQKRKAFSDPVKKCVEEAGRSFEKSHRRVTTHLNKTDIFKEDDDTETESSNTHKQDFHFLQRQRFQRKSDLIEKNREFAKKAIVPANPFLKRRIPSFLRVYSQASSSNDILLQWHLFNLSELESFVTMITRLYKNENLARVQLYEIYRSALHSALASKTSSNTDVESDAITTPL